MHTAKTTYQESDWALSTSDLSIGFIENKSPTVIAEALNLKLPKGALIGLIGINGSGKSTLLRTLSGLQKPLSGTIKLGNQELETIAETTLAKQLSVVLTNQGISKNLTVAELIALGRQPYTNWLGQLTLADKRAIQHAINATTLAPFTHRKCFTLSDGQLQRALIARALAQETDVILLDEPTTHLDLHHKASVFMLLKEISLQTQKTILFSTHDIELTLPLCDYFIVLNEKQAVMETPENLIANGVFDQIFPSERIGFDTKNKRFFIKK